MHEGCHGVHVGPGCAAKHVQAAAAGQHAALAVVLGSAATAIVTAALMHSLLTLLPLWIIRSPGMHAQLEQYGWPFVVASTGLGHSIRGIPT